MPVNPKTVSLDTKVSKVKLYNEIPTEEAVKTPFGGETSGIMNPSDGMDWSIKLWDAMYNNDWRPNEVDTTNDGIGYKNLSPELQKSFDKVLASLIFNDSAQTVNLGMSVLPYVTNGNISLVIARQLYEEALHTTSYDAIVKDVSVNRDDIYELHLKDEELAKRNRYLANMYTDIAEGNNNVTIRQLFKSAIANNILEGIMFYGGFLFFWALGEKVRGTAEMIAFIARDERMHVLLFQQIITNALKSFPNIPKQEVEKIAREMVIDVTESEIEWLKGLSKHLPNFSDTAIERYFYGKADDLMKGMTFEKIYNEPESPLKAYEKMYAKPNEVRANFFEAKPKTYTAKKLSMEGL